MEAVCKGLVLSLLHLVVVLRLFLEKVDLGVLEFEECSFNGVLRRVKRICLVSVIYIG